MNGKIDRLKRVSVKVKTVRTVQSTSGMPADS
jgi:hypothetical protein